MEWIMARAGMNGLMNSINKNVIMALAIAMCLFIGWVGIYAGNEFSFVVLYVIPAGLAAWFAGPAGGVFISFFSALTWLLGDMLAGRAYSEPFIPYINAASRMIMYMIITLLVSTVRIQLNKQTKSANEDFLTKISNSRAFFSYVSMEIERLKRYKEPFTLAYFDVDNFKNINDTYGHNAGDGLLTKLARAIRTHIRPTDVVARMGGDEFAILLIETKPEQARAAIEKLAKVMKASMRTKSMNITFSIGVVTFLKPPKSIDEMIKKADDMMYLSKKGGKDAVNYSIYR